MFRFMCMCILAVCFTGLVWLQTVTQEDFDSTVEEVQETINSIESAIWDKIASRIEEQQKIGELQEKDMRFVRAYLRSRLGSDAYLELAENNCLDSVVYKLAVFDSKWLDNWCANQYRHIEPWYKNDIMLYMSYRYEASQPESLKHSIKVARLGN